MIVRATVSSHRASGMSAFVKAHIHPATADTGNCCDVPQLAVPCHAPRLTYFHGVQTLEGAVAPGCGWSSLRT